MVCDKSENRMFSFFKQIFNISKTSHVISVQIDKHFVTTEPTSFEHSSFLIPSQIDSQKCQMNIITTFSQNCNNFIQLRWKNNFIYIWKVHR